MSSAAALSSSALRAEMTMIGMRLHERTERMISLPSISGRPRSSSSRSGQCEAIISSAVLPSVASMGS